MLFKGLTIGDIHVGAGDPELLNTELKIFENYIKASDDLDMVVFTGDFFHKKLTANDIAFRYGESFFYRVLRLCAAKDILVRVIQGTTSHDHQQLLNFKSYEEHYDNLRVIFKVENEVLSFENGDETFELSILWVPEEYPEDMKAYYSGILFDLGLEEGEAAYDLCFGHGTFDFQAWASQKQESERHIKSAPVFDSALFTNIIMGGTIFGHIHTRSSKGTVTYPASFSRNAHGEEGDKGFAEFSYDLNSLDYSVKFINNTLAPVFKTIDYDVADGVTLEEKIIYILEELADCYKLRIFYRLNRSDESRANLALLKEYFSSYSQVSFKEDRIDIEMEEGDEENLEESVSAYLARYSYILDNDINIVEVIRKYLKEDRGLSISDEMIEKFISPEATSVPKRNSSTQVKEEVEESIIATVEKLPVEEVPAEVKSVRKTSSLKIRRKTQVD
jgi:DNA repair exonuclease SbcCD nuclease subunit